MKIRFKFIFFVLILLFFLNKCENQNNKVIEKRVDKPEEVFTLSITAVGDVMPGTQYPSERLLPPNDGIDIFDSVKTYLGGTDIVFGNLEGVLLEGEFSPRKYDDSSISYRFQIPERYAGLIKSAGFNLINTANNHALDFEDIGAERTLEVLDSVGLNHFGLISKPYTVQKIRNKTVCFIGFSANHGALRIQNINEAVDSIKKLDSIYDIIVVSFHGGGEGNKFRNITRETEIFADENRGNPYQFAHAVIDAGADAVIGHGPHVTRAMEIYRNRLIAYSLGNFCTYRKFNLKGSQGIAPILKFDMNEKGEFLSGMIIPIKQIKNGYPVLDNKKQVLNELITLSKEDFPESILEISENGKLILKK